MKKKIAQIISIAGHPLLTLPLFVLFATFTLEDFKKAFITSSIIIGGFFLPLILRLYLK